MVKLKNTATAAFGLVALAILQTAVIPVGKAVFKAIFDVEVQDAWKDGAHPIIAATWPRMAAMLEWLNTFWGGALFVLAIVFCAEVLSVRKRRLAQDHSEREAVLELARQSKALSEEIVAFVIEQPEHPWPKDQADSETEAFQISTQRHNELRAQRFFTKFVARMLDVHRRAEKLVAFNQQERIALTDLHPNPFLQKEAARVLGSLPDRLAQAMAKPSPAVSPSTQSH